MKIELKNWIIVLTLCGVITATFALGWLSGRASSNTVTESIIQGQNQIISTYAYQVGDLQGELQRKVTLLEAQKSVIRYNEKQISDIRVVQDRILRELKALKVEIKKQEQYKPFLPDNAIFLPDMVLY